MANSLENLKAQDPLEWPPQPYKYMGVTIIPAGWQPEDDTEPVKPMMVGGVTWEIASNVVVKSIKWLWPNRLPRGKVSLIAGYPNQGKSQILCSLAAIITTGGEWPNGEGKCEKGAVMILAAEDTSSDMLVPRLLAAGADLDQVIIVRPLVIVQEEGRKFERVFSLEGDLKRLQGMIGFEKKKNNRIVTAVLIDPLNAYYGSGEKNFDIHKTGDMRKMLTPVSQWCGDKNIAVIGIGHFNKGNNSHMLYRITDSSAITAVCRAVFFALKDEESGQFYFVEAKKNVGKEAPGLQYAIKDRGTDRWDAEDGLEVRAPYIEWGQPSQKSVFEIMGGAKGSERHGEWNAASDFVLRALQHHKTLTRATLESNAKEYGITPKALRMAIERLNLKPIKSGFPAVVSYSLDVTHQPTDDLADADDDPILDNDQANAGFG